MRPLVFVPGLFAGLAAALTITRRLDVVEVDGHSMAPALLPGDRLLVESISYARRPPRPGEVVLARDPRHASRELVKRVAASDGEHLELLGDSPAASTDSREFGAIPIAEVHWRAVIRYWPPRRLAFLAGLSRPLTALGKSGGRSGPPAAPGHGVRRRGTHQR